MSSAKEHELDRISDQESAQLEVLATAVDEELADANGSYGFQLHTGYDNERTHHCRVTELCRNLGNERLFSHLKRTIEGALVLRAVGRMVGGATAIVG